MLGSQVMGQSQGTLFQCWASIPDKTNPLSAFAWWAIYCCSRYKPIGYINCVPDVQQRKRGANIDPTLIHELKNMQFQLNIYLIFKSRVEE